MTPPEPALLPAGLELDALVAERVMGWYVSPSGLCDSDRKPGDVFIGDVCEIIPSFSTDIAAAWKVVEHFYRQTCLAVSLTMRGWDCWRCEMGRAAAEADTAPLAICRASLLVAEGLPR